MLFNRIFLKRLIGNSLEKVIFPRYSWTKKLWVHSIERSFQILARKLSLWLPQFEAHRVAAVV